MPTIFDTFQLGPNLLRNRIVMAPMTRSRALSHAPDDDTVLYYRQRATAGLIITEGTPFSEEARGYAYTPGIYTRDQVDGWRRVTEAVHAEDGKIFCQLWHVGRQSHVSLQPGRGAPVSSSATAANMSVWGFDDNRVAFSYPASPARALETGEIRRVIADLASAAQNAMDAGFDGVEIHAANGYLFEQFINGTTNRRTDAYGGSIENRLRFVLEALDVVTDVVGAARTGIRVAPFGRFGDMHPFDGEEETWLAVARAFSDRPLAYVHLSDQETLGAEAIPAGFVDKFRRHYRGNLVLAGGFERESAQAALDAGRAELIAIGRPFIANPDLVERYKNGWPVATPDRATFYAGGRTGYVDYPAFQSGQENAA